MEYLGIKVNRFIFLFLRVSLPKTSLKFPFGFYNRIHYQSYGKTDEKLKYSFEALKMTTYDLFSYFGLFFEKRRILRELNQTISSTYIFIPPYTIKWLLIKHRTKNNHNAR